MYTHMCIYIYIYIYSVPWRAKWPVISWAHKPAAVPPRLAVPASSCPLCPTRPAAEPRPAPPRSARGVSGFWIQQAAGATITAATSMHATPLAALGSRCPKSLSPRKNCRWAVGPLGGVPAEDRALRAKRQAALQSRANQEATWLRGQGQPKTEPFGKHAESSTKHVNNTHCFAHFLFHGAKCKPFSRPCRSAAANG